MQVKDLTKNEMSKYLSFNGWTFASDPSLTPFVTQYTIYSYLIVIMFNKIFLLPAN